MTWTKRIDFTAWPIGQGLFTQADIWVGKKFFRLVYDCGTFCSDRQITAAAFRAIRNRRIDLLVISHFHWDHISRIPELLQCAGEIREVWIPYLTPEQRLLFALSTVAGGFAAGNEGPEMSEIIDLAIRGRDWFETRGCIVHEIGGDLPGSEGEFQEVPYRPDENVHLQKQDKHDSKPPTELRLGTLKRLSEAFALESSFRAYNAPVEGLSGSRCLEAPVELVTWVRPISNADKDLMMNELEQWFDSIGVSWKPNDILARDNGSIDRNEFSSLAKALGAKANRSQVREIYLKLNSDLNAGSLFLLAHPTQRVARYRAHFRTEQWTYFGTDTLTSAPTVLWTGDAPSSVLNQLLADANSTLTDHIDATYIHQFPHHGSASSISRSWISEIGKRWSDHLPMSLISAGRSNSFGHPSPEALWRCPSIVVSEGSAPYESSLEWR